MEMKKKFTFICLLLCSILCLFACNNDPYKNMKLEVYHDNKIVTENDVINLNIKDEGNGVYSYDEVTLLVKVQDDNDETDRQVSIGDGQGFVTTSAEFDPVTGTTSINVKACSVDNTGKVALRIATNEGNKSILIHFNIDLALENFEFKENALDVVGKGTSVSLANIDKFITFTPSNTTQKDLTLSMANLEVAGDGVTYFVDGWADGGNFSYQEDGQRYASLVDGVLTTYDTYNNGSGDKTKIKYPIWVKSSSMGGDPIQQEVIIIKASYYFAESNEIINRFLMIPVVESCSEISVNMNAQSGDSAEFELPRNSNGEYEMVLIDPKYENDIFNASVEYYIERELNFYLSDDFHIEADPTDDSSAVQLVPITGEDHFKVHAMKAGVYKHEFRIVHDEYPDLFDQKVVIEFTVKDLPTDILINNSKSTQIFTIYDYYANSAKGTKIDVNLNTKVGQYEYSVYTNNYDGILNVNLNSARSTENLVFANLIDGKITTTVEGKPYTKFNATDSFYLSHSFETLPSMSVSLSIGVQISLCSDSYYNNYSEEELNSMFKLLLMTKSFVVSFQMGLRSFDFDSEKLNIDLTNPNYLDGADPSKGKLICTLPEGQSIETAIAKMEYDSSLVTIVEYTPAERNARTSLYAQCNTSRLEGSTLLKLTANNGVTGEIGITTYMPTIYTAYSAENKIPLAISVDEKSGGYLYSVSGSSTGAVSDDDIYADYISHKDPFMMLDGIGEYLGTYDSLHTLFGLIDGKITLKFYDYTYINESFEPYNISSKIAIYFNNDGYINYSYDKSSDSIVLTLRRLATDKNDPIVMTIKYTGGYEATDEGESLVYKEVTLEHKVKVYVYSPLQGVNILSEKSSNLYVYDSLSYFDRTTPEIGSTATRNLSTNTIKASFSPAEETLGMIWNDFFGSNPDDDTVGYKPLLLWYECKMLDEAVKDKNDKGVIIQSNIAGNDYYLTYGDLFQITPVMVNDSIYSTTITCRLSEELLAWIEEYYGGVTTLNNKVQSFLNNYILDKDYTMIVNVYASQFGKLRNVNTISYTCSYATKINSLKLNVDDDGVYFDIRDIKEQVNNGKIQTVIEYSIDNAKCINKEMIIIGGTTNHFDTTIEYGSGNTGKIIVTPVSGVLSGAVYDLKIILKDNVSNYSLEDGYSYYNDSLNQTIRVKVADGSSAFAFEIRTASEFKEMLEDIKNANESPAKETKYMYYHYVIARENINLSGVVLETLDITRSDRGVFSLSGKHIYNHNGESVCIYGKIYNLTITRKISNLNENVNIGLFGEVGSSAKFDNVSLLNASITISALSAFDTSKVVSAGILAGKISGATISSIVVSGSIKVNINMPKGTLSVGGVVGYGTGSISGKPEYAISGVSSTGNNAKVEIDITGGSYSTLEVGGIIGEASANSAIQMMQIVSNISVKAQAYFARIGGVSGRNEKTTTFSGLQVSPVISIEKSSAYSLYAGGIIGYMDGGTISNSKVYFVNIGEGYSQKDKVNIYVSATITKDWNDDYYGTMKVGGLVGELSSGTVRYSYARSFYNSEVKSGSYMGNIYAEDLGENYDNIFVGGIAGTLGSYFLEETNLISSYFDGDIMVSSYGQTIIEEGNTDTNYDCAMIGLITGSSLSTKNNKLFITGSYGVGNIYYNMTWETFDLRGGSETSSVENKFIPKTDVDSYNALFGDFYYSSSMKTEDDLLGKSYDCIDFAGSATVENVYGVANNKYLYFVEEGTKLVSVDSMQTIIDDGVANNTWSLFKNVLHYNITDGSAEGSLTASNYRWFYNDKVNTAGGHAYPILLSSTGLAMYDLVPTGIDIIINSEKDSIFDLSYVDEKANKHNQMVMFVKKTNDGTYSNDYYEIMVERETGSDNATIKVVFNGEDIVTDLVTINIDDNIEILLKDNDGVLELSSNRIYPKKEGEATIEIRSYLDKTIKTSIAVKVIASVDTIKMYEIVGSNKVEVNKEITGRDVEHSVVYIDETSNFEISAKDSENYEPTRNIGYILELLSEEDAENNGSIIIDGKKYSYNAEGNNTYLLDATNVLKASGDKLGYVRFKLTPYLKLGDMYYEDTYTSQDGSEIKFSGTLNENVYILNKAGKLDISSEYVLVIMARAISVDNSVKVAEITSKNEFEVISTIETSNVLASIGEDNKTTYTLLEDVYVDMSLYNTKIDYTSLKQIKLEGISWEVSSSDETYYFNNPYKFEYELLNMKVTGFTIMKTNINPETRLNTYKISIIMSVSFDKEFYRENASKYDLNTVKFDINIIPYSNLLLDSANENAPYGLKNDQIIGTTVVNIAPAGLTDIFMNYYSRGEGLLGNTENTYPSDNESNFIVPNRDGLLKITLAEEFNNSSYVTVTLDKKYSGYVRLEQMAGILQSVDSGNSSEFDTYQELDYYDPVETSEYFGIRLQKLTSNSNNKTYFNNTYFVKVTLSDTYSNEIYNSPSYNGELLTVDISVTSYTIANNGSVKETLPEPKVKTLTIADLPSLVVEVDNASVLNMGIGVKKEMSIKYRGLTNDIMVNSSNNNLFVVDESGEKVASLSIEYLDNGGKYYLCLAVDAYDELDTAGVYTLTLSAEEYVWGMLETTNSQLWISPVEFEITGVKLQDSYYNKDTKENELIINHGQSVILRLDLQYADIEVALDTETDANGNNKKIAEHIARLETYYKYGRDGETFSPKQLVEYAIAGTTVTSIVNGVETELSRGILDLYRVTYSGDKKELTPIVGTGIRGGIEILHDSYRSSYDSDISNPVIEILYTLLRGVSISTDNLLRMSVPYYYENGRVVAGKSATEEYYDEYIEFRVIIKDNSSDTHPTPIENQEDLLAYAGTLGHYILVNNITLQNWTPVPLSVDSLDGNGYVITISSFDMSTIRSASDVNAGIFTTIGENTLVKNLTIDIGNMLTTEDVMLNDINIIKNSTSDRYIHDQAGKIDLTFVSNLNFGILAGENNGSITNVKVVNTKNFNQSSSESRYLHILTSQIDKEGNATSSNIGGIVGVNSATGAISNSFVGVNISTEATVTLGDGSKETRHYIEVVTKPDTTEYHNRYDEMTEIQVFPFVLAGSNNVAGAVVTNNGIISNSYTKGLGIYNSYPAVGNSITAGLVGVNNNKVTSCFVEGNEIKSYRATGKYAGETEHRDTIEAVGSVGGLVYTNNSLIENSYANVYLTTQSSFIAGFVFTNNGTISNSYSTSVNKNNWAYGPFTGVLNKVVQNFGTYNNCYYLVVSEELETKNETEDAIPIYTRDFTDSVNTELSDFWRGFSFTSQSGANDEDGIWTMGNSLPKIATTLIDTNSFRILDQIEDVSGEDGIVEYQRYSYIYGTAYQEGSRGNPLVIESAKTFSEKLIGRGRTININGKDEYVFGAVNSRDILDVISAVEYVRLVNNLDFSADINRVDGRYLYETIFAGKLDGNGMSMNNVHIDTDSTNPLENFGMFSQVGVDASLASSITVIKNLNITLSSFNGHGDSKAGVLAGTIKNATIANVNIDGNGVEIAATNMAGALAGLILADGQNKVSIVDVGVQNITVEATNKSLGGEIDAFTQDQSKGKYNRFNILNKENNIREEKHFETLETELKNNVLNIKNTSQVSYAGAVAGVLIANNLDEIESGSLDVNNYRSGSDPCSIDNVVVSGAITIKNADNSGGLFGYLSSNSRIKNCKFELSSNSQLIKSWNFAGGIVGENYGIIEQCFVSYDDKTQSEYDATMTDGENWDNGSVNLFYMSDGDFYNVAVGGIAGYSKGGAIVDSYSKASVIQPLAFIAGGIIGYADSLNYIGYSYSTGSVYAKVITGGVIGLQVSSEDDSQKIVYLDTVVGLNNWNTHRDDISKVLYSNYKSLYTNGTGFDNFYLKMPEIGNQDITQTALNASYVAGHSNQYVGSVIGASYIFDNNGEKSTSKDIISLYSNSNVKSVFSTTYGILSTESGAIEDGNRNDTYFNETFDLELGVDEAVSLYSYRVAYNESAITSNSYTVDDSTTTGSNSSNYLDKISFAKIFTSQEYVEQLLGVFYTYEEAEEGVSGTMSKTYNIFKGYNEDRYQISGNDNVFVDNTIGETSVWGMDDYLPEINDGTYVLVEYLYAGNEADKTKLKSILSSSTNDKTYYLVPGNEGGTSTDNEFTIDLVDDRDIVYLSAIRSAFIGQTVSGVRPKIVFNLNNTIGTIFNLISGATFSNVDIVVNIPSTQSNNLSTISKTSTAYGVLANTLENVTLNNVSITLNYLNSSVNPTFNAYDGGIKEYKAVNNGLLFGEVANSVIKDSVFKVLVNSNKVILENTTIENFGLFAGSAYRSYLLNNSFEITGSGSSDITIEIEKVAKSSNIGGLIGILKNSTYKNCGIKSSAGAPKTITIVDNYNSSLIIDDNEVARTKSVSSLFGSAYNSSINLTDRAVGLYDTMKVAYSNTSNATNLDIINVGAIAGISQNTKYVGINLSNYVVSASTTALVSISSSVANAQMSVGGLIGKDADSSQIGELVDDSTIGNASAISVTAYTKLLSVGGVVGYTSKATKIYNAYNMGTITVTNTRLGTKAQKVDGNGNLVYSNGSPVYEYTYANTYVGGILGSAMGRITMEAILSSGNVTVNGKSDTDDTAGFGLGGLIGYMTYSSELSTFTILCDFYFGSTFTSKVSNAYVSGIVGLNKGSFGAENGYVYGEFRFDTTGNLADVVTSATTNNRITSVSNVFYAQEFVGNNYTTDSKFTSFAMADVNNALSQYSALTKLSGVTRKQTKVYNADKKAYVISNVIFPIADGLKNLTIEVESNSSETLARQDGKTRFTIRTYTSSDTVIDTTNKYVAINADGDGITVSAIGILPKGNYISGRSNSTGKALITLNYSKSAVSTGYFVGTNNGVISNIYMRSSKKTGDSTVDELNVALVKTNNGLITDSYVYERTTSQFGLAETNNGRIYKSATATIYLGEEDEIYGLVKINAGTISDCYSASAGYTENDSKTTDVYMVLDNGVGEVKGSIINSFYYIPDILDFDNVVKGVYKKHSTTQEGKPVDLTKQGNVTNVYNTKNPSFVSSRTSIWGTENEHGQINGIKDIAGAMVLHIYYAKEGSSSFVDISTIGTLRMYLTTNNPSKSNHRFKYKIHFYESGTPKYNVVRVVKASDLTDYIDSLVGKTYTIPTKTVVAIFNDISVSPDLLHSFSLSYNSMLVGLVNTDKDGVTTDRRVIDFGGKDMSHEFIKTNSGILANFILRRLSIVYTEQTGSFAPILTNSISAVICNIQLGYDKASDSVGIKIQAPLATTVSGLIATNNGMVYNATLYSLNIQSLYYYAIFICLNNAGKDSYYINNLRYVNLSTSSRLYTGSGAYNG